ncbi:MAG: hypothetical protein JWR19_1552 [Pedosphaera sp.]|nr:hypothetical protein [Pedosphaera sp.]
MLSGWFEARYALGCPGSSREATEGSLLGKKSLSRTAVFDYLNLQV